MSAPLLLRCDACGLVVVAADGQVEAGFGPCPERTCEGVGRLRRYDPRVERDPNPAAHVAHTFGWAILEARGLDTMAHAAVEGWAEHLENASRTLRHELARRRMAQAPGGSA